jgi:hypothetical protein
MNRTRKIIGSPEQHKSAYNTSNSCAASIMDISLPLDFKEFLKLLNDKGVEYLLIGGYAVAYYGYPRATNDIDVWIAVNPKNAERVVDALREFGFDTPDLSIGLFLAANRIIRMGMPPMRIEISTGISGVNFEECYAARRTDVLNGVEVPIISLRHLKENKRASGRHKDLNDLENLP